MQIFRGNEKELKEQFDINPLGVVFIGLLRSKKVYLTEPVLELCTKKSPLEGLIKNRTLLSTLDNFPDFETLQAIHDPERNFPLTILDVGTERIIALADEILAEEGWQQSSEVESSSTALKTVHSHLSGLESLFSSEEIARLKVAIGTAVSPDERIDSIRKMTFSQLEKREKFLLFFHALADKNVEVRTEAILALEKSGFHPEIAEEMLSLNKGDEEQKEYAIGSLSKLFSEVGELEQGAILQIILTLLQDSQYERLGESLFQAVDDFSPHLPANQGMLERIMATALKNLVSKFSLYHKKIYSILLSLDKIDHDLLEDFLWHELSKSSGRNQRSFFLVLLCEIQVREERMPVVMEQAIREIGLGDELDPFYLQLLGSLHQMGEKTVISLLERLQESNRVGERIQLVGLLDNVCREYSLPLSQKEEIIKVYIDIFSLAHNKLRESMLDSSLLNDPDLPARLKTNLAREALIDIHSEGFDQFPEVVRAALLQIKKPAIDAILQVLRNPLNTMQAIRATDFLGDVVLELDLSHTSEVEKIKDFCFKQIKKNPDNVRELFKVLGKIVLAKATQKDDVQSIAHYLLDNVCKSHPYAILEALGWAGSSPLLEEEVTTDICCLLMALLDNRLPENISKTTQNDEGTRYEFDFKTTAYTDLLPILISGLERIATGSSTPKSIRRLIVNKLLGKWKRLVSHKLVWGPKNITDLGQTIYRLSISPVTEVPIKIQLVEALFAKVAIFSITELLAEILSEAKEEELLEWSARLCEKLLEFATHQEYQNQEDKEVILRCIGTMLKAPSLSPKNRESSRYRENMLYQLFEGLREKVFGVNNILKDLLSSPHIPKKLQKEIGKRLPKPTRLVFKNS